MATTKKMALKAATTLLLLSHGIITNSSIGGMIGQRGRVYLDAQTNHKAPAYEVSWSRCQVGCDHTDLLAIEGQLSSTYSAIAPRSNSFVEQRQVGRQREIGQLER